MKIDKGVKDEKPVGQLGCLVYWVGIEHIGLGSDFDGAIMTRFDASQLVVLTQTLMNRGYSEDDIRHMMGGNVLRVLRQVLPE